jgi:hypothetical protein
MAVKLPWPRTTASFTPTTSLLKCAGLRTPTIPLAGFMVTDHSELSASAPVPTETHSAPLPITPQDVPALVPRAAWMLEGDDRFDEQADDDWRRACGSLFGTQTSSVAEQSSSSTTDLPPAAKMSFFDEEYVSVRRVPSPTEMDAKPSGPSREPIGTNATLQQPINTIVPTGMRSGPPAKIADLRDRINRALSARTAMPDFPSSRIPYAEFNPTVTVANCIVWCTMRLRMGPRPWTITVTMRTTIDVLAHSSMTAIDLSIRSTPSIWIGHHDRSNNHLIRPHTWRC